MIHWTKRLYLSNNRWRSKVFLVTFVTIVFSSFIFIPFTLFFRQHVFCWVFFSAVSWQPKTLSLFTRKILWIFQQFSFIPSYQTFRPWMSCDGLPTSKDHHTYDDLSHMNFYIITRITKLKKKSIFINICIWWDYRLNL